jgi:hypothetical protein
MPNDSRSRIDKREKEKKRKDKKDPKHLRRKQAADDADASSPEKEDTQAEEALAVSVPHLGAKPGNKALDNSLSAFPSLPSLAEAKDSLGEKMNSPPSHEDSEDSGNPSDGCMLAQYQYIPMISYTYSTSTLSYFSTKTLS